MTDNSTKVYNLLKRHIVPISLYKIADVLEVPVRSLQRSGDDEGILERIRAEIFEETGMIVVTNFTGTIMTDSPEVASEHIAQVWARVNNSYLSLQAMRKRIEMKMGKQMRLAL